ncbi:MAG TPA: EamA family transporter [Steroidobacteraceae bacterium]|jgi:drug/metabolite transporter (DMT)-like permease|nr:EamA family transporter [Steroidobacteraceae bacterium]
MTFRVWLAFLALCVIWGTPYFFIKKAVVEVSPVLIAWGRITLGSLVLLPIAWHMGALRNITKHVRWLVVFAVVELVGPFWLIALGEQAISSSLAGILLSAVPLTVVMIAPLMGVKERLGMRRWAGLIIGLVGVAALLGIDSLHGSHEWLGAGCILLSTLGYALGPLIVQRHLSDTHPLGVVAASTLVGSLVLLIPAVLAAPSAMPSSVAVTSIAVLGIVCTALALVLFVYVISNAGASKATVVTYVNPAVAVLLGVWILDEHFGVGAGIGLVLILLGCWMANSGGETAH